MGHATCTSFLLFSGLIDSKVASTCPSHQSFFFYARPDQGLFTGYKRDPGNKVVTAVTLNIGLLGSNLHNKVPKVPACMDCLEAAAICACICFQSAGGKLIIVKRL